MPEVWQDSAEFQVHCLGNSADLGALRRSLEARGVVSRSRLTPAVGVVVADSTVSADHPTLVTARELGIEVLQPSEAVDRLLSAPSRARERPPHPPASRTSAITFTVIVLVSLLALLGFVGAIVDNGPREATDNQQVSVPFNPR